MNILKAIHHIAASIVLGSLLASCSLIEDDLPECGLNLYFRYDYNLQRANMFADHVGCVRAYVYDANGKFVTQQTESASNGFSPFKRDGYHMHLNLPKGEYKVIAVAFQKDYAQTLLTPGAKLRYTEPQSGDDIRNMRFELEHAATPNEQGAYAVDHQNAPLDTLWVGMSGNQLTARNYVAQPEAELISTGGGQSAHNDTICLVRNTKQINVTLREIESSAQVDVNDYDFCIIDHNATLLWNNEVDESKKLLYSPYHTWNTSDRPNESTTIVGQMAHADFMTSRIIYHDNANNDAQLCITHRETGKEVVRVNLADLLSRLKTSADIYRYSPQQFLDRGYDYELTFFLQGGRLKYVNVEISILGWHRRYQVEDLEM